MTIRISVHVQPLKNRIVLKKRKARDSRQAYASDEEDDTAFRQPSKVGHVPPAIFLFNSTFLTRIRGFDTAGNNVLASRHPRGRVTVAYNTAWVVRM